MRSAGPPKAKQAGAGPGGQMSLEDIMNQDAAYRASMPQFTVTTTTTRTTVTTVTSTTATSTTVSSTTGTTTTRTSTATSTTTSTTTTTVTATETSATTTTGTTTDTSVTKTTGTTTGTSVTTTTGTITTGTGTSTNTSTSTSTTATTSGTTTTGTPTTATSTNTSVTTTTTGTATTATSTNTSVTATTTGTATTATTSSTSTSTSDTSSTTLSTTSTRASPKSGGVAGAANLLGQCLPKPRAGSPSLFCFCVMRPETSELQLLRLQIARRAGIFACEDHSVFSHANETTTLCTASGDLPAMVTEALPAAPSARGSILIPGQTTNSWLNAKTFMEAWDRVITEGRYKRHEWVAKVDPDAVFLPDRLRKRLRALALPSQLGFYVLNCDMWGRRMFGALEVYSHGAVEAYAAGRSRCKKLKWQGWGEDYYMQQCMEALSVNHALDFKMVSDFNGHCTHEPPSGCAEGEQAAFHPMKLPDAYLGCMKQAASRDALLNQWPR